MRARPSSNEMFVPAKVGRMKVSKRITACGARGAECPVKKLNLSKALKNSTLKGVSAGSSARRCQGYETCGVQRCLMQQLSAPAWSCKCGARLAVRALLLCRAGQVPAKQGGK